MTPRSQLYCGRTRLPIPPFALRSFPTGAFTPRGVPMKTFLALIGLLAIFAGIGAAIFFFGGFYSVAGTAEQPKIVTWALTQVRQASIARHATERSRPGGPGS